jgi:hypothetical protein
VALEDPSISEIIRDIDDRTRRIEESMGKYVPRETYDLQHQSVLDRLTALETKGRQWWTVFALPAMVAVFVWLIQETVK